MQALPEISKQNAVASAIELTKADGETRFVINDAPERYSVSTQDPGPGNAVYIARASEWEG